MKQLSLKIKKLNPKAKLPTYANPGDAGLDLYTFQNVKIKPKERKIIGTGIAIELPSGNYVGLVWAKSGLGIKEGLLILGGVLDSSYRGEIMIGLYNSSRKSYQFKKGDKIAQLLIQPIATCQIKEVKNLSKTKRGAGRFGSSGKR